MLSLSPVSLFFSYTTLFRSVDRCVREQVRERRFRDEEDRRWRVPGEGQLGRVHLAGGRVALGGIGGHLDRVSQDRKSTRLNSSHVAISYAVFCLKKQLTRLG